jgi:RNA polymerase sigma-70 factor, ECF subfamily
MDTRSGSPMALPQGSSWLSRVLRGTHDRDETQDDPAAHLHSLYGLALKLTRNPAAAEDLVQDTYLKATRFAPRFRRGTNRRAWLFTILRNTFLNDRRGAKREPVEVDTDLVESLPLPTGDDDPEGRLLRAARDADVHAAFDTLPQTYREVVWLRDVEDCSYKEIAEIVGVPIGTVMSRLSRGRRLLHQQLTSTNPAAAAPAQAPTSAPVVEPSGASTDVASS